MDAYSALIDFSDPAQPQGPRLRHAFGAARQTLVAHRLDQVRGVLEAVQAAAQQGLWCVGYLRYEAAPAFDAALTVHAATGPLAWFAVYDQALPWPDPADLNPAAWQTGARHTAAPRRRGRPRRAWPTRHPARACLRLLRQRIVSWSCY